MSFAVSHRDQGLRALQDGDARTALRHLELALREAPDDAEALACLGVACGMLNMPAQAAVRLEAAARLEPTSEFIQYNLGWALEQSGRMEEAVAAYRQTLAIRPGHPKAQKALQRLLAAPTLPGVDRPLEEAAPTGTVELPETEPHPEAPGTAAVSAEAGAQDSGAEPTPSAPAPTARPQWPWYAVAAALVVVAGTVGTLVGLNLRKPQPAGTAPTVPQVQSPAVPAPGPGTEPRIERPAPIVPSVSSGPGLGIAREEVIRFVNDELAPRLGDPAFDFAESSPTDGLPRVIGRSADGGMELELLGEAGNLSSLGIAFQLPQPDWSGGKDDERAVALLDRFAPGSSSWALGSLASMQEVGGSLEREQAFGERMVRITWTGSSRSAHILVVPREEDGGAGESERQPERDWTRDLSLLPTDRRYRFTGLDGSVTTGTLLRHEAGVLTVRPDEGGDEIQLRTEDVAEVEPMEPTENEKDWLRNLRDEVRRLRREALSRGDANGERIEEGRRYRFTLRTGREIEGLVLSLQDDLYRVQTEESTSLVIRPEDATQIVPVEGEGER